MNLKRYGSVARRSAVAALFGVCLIPIAGADTSSVASSAELGSLSGAEIYGHICQACHMPDGKGAIGAGRYPALAGDLKFVSWQFVALTVIGGRNGMPAFGRSGTDFDFPRAVHLDDAQIAAVVNYVRKSFGNRYKEVVTAKEVAALPHAAK